MGQVHTLSLYSPSLLTANHITNLTVNKKAIRQTKSKNLQRENTDGKCYVTGSECAVSRYDLHMTHITASVTIRLPLFQNYLDLA